MAKDPSDGIHSGKPTLGQMRAYKMWSLTKLSQESGVAVTTIAAIERGAKPRLATIEKLSRALACAPGDISWPSDTPYDVREHLPTTLRRCLEWLAATGKYTLDNGMARIRPERLLVGTDLETSWLQAQATLEMYPLSSDEREAGDVVGALHAEHMVTIADGPQGKELVFRRERWAVIYAPSN